MFILMVDGVAYNGKSFSSKEEVIEALKEIVDDQDIINADNGDELTFDELFDEARQDTIFIENIFAGQYDIELSIQKIKL